MTLSTSTFFNCFKRCRSIESDEGNPIQIQKLDTAIKQLENILWWENLNFRLLPLMVFLAGGGVTAGSLYQYNPTSGENKDKGSSAGIFVGGSVMIGSVVWACCRTAPKDYKLDTLRNIPNGPSIIKIAEKYRILSSQNTLEMALRRLKAHKERLLMSEPIPQTHIAVPYSPPIFSEGNLSDDDIPPLSEILPTDSPSSTAQTTSSASSQSLTMPPPESDASTTPLPSSAIPGPAVILSISSSPKDGENRTEVIYEERKETYNRPAYMSRNRLENGENVTQYERAFLLSLQDWKDDPEIKEDMVKLQKNPQFKFDSVVLDNENEVKDFLQGKDKGIKASEFLKDFKDDKCLLLTNSHGSQFDGILSGKNNSNIKITPEELIESLLRFCPHVVHLKIKNLGCYGGTSEFMPRLMKHACKLLMTPEFSKHPLKTITLIGSNGPALVGRGTTALRVEDNVVNGRTVHTYDIARKPLPSQVAATVTPEVANSANAFALFISSNNASSLLPGTTSAAAMPSLEELRKLRSLHTGMAY